VHFVQTTITNWNNYTKTHTHNTDLNQLCGL